MERVIREFLEAKPGYLKKSNEYILDRLGIYPPTKKRLKTCARIKREITNSYKDEEVKAVNVKKADYQSYISSKKEKLHIPKENYKKSPALQYDPKNILVIGDLHEPFCLDGYLEHCIETQDKYKCGTVIFIGDVIDNHFASYHETDPDGFGAGEELERAIHKLKRWYKAFPEATVLIGNHDRLIYRKAYSSGLSRRWIRNLNEVLETPNWDFVEEITINGVNYNHGEGGTARTRAKNEMQSQVQGHLHAQFYIEYNVSPSMRLFAMQVGCGVDRKAYAMAYGKHFKKPVIGCGVVLGDIPTPHLVPMILE
jgi:metallophosphoesterase superfamily enzyme